MMDYLHNGEPLPSSLHNSSNNDQPQEHLAADDVKMSPSTNDPQSVGNEVTIRANAPSTEEPTYVQKTSTDEDTIRQESTQQTAASTEETTNSTSNEPTIIIAPAQIKLSPLSNEAPTQEASPAGQDINGTPQPLTNPGPSPYPLGGTWQNPPGGTWQNPPPGMWSGYQQPVSTRPPKPLSRLARPLPLWALLGGIVLIIGLLVALHLTGSDWGQGAANASRAAVYIGIILVVVLILRSLNWQNSSGMASSLNPTRVRQYIVSLLCIIVIFVYSGVSQALVPTLHIAQGRSQEGQRQWQTA